MGGCPIEFGAGAMATLASPFVFERNKQKSSTMRSWLSYKSASTWTGLHVSA
jgi:hypothetical protein